MTHEGRVLQEGTPADAHVRQAQALFRACGFDITAMQFKRTPESLAALRAFNNVPDSWQHPVSWEYHPNQWCATKGPFRNLE